GVGRPNLLPVLVTGSRNVLGPALLEALARALEDAYPRRKPSQIIKRIRDAAACGEKESPSIAIGLVRETADYLRESGKAAGVLVVLDELGKFLEYAALHPERQDVYFLQALAEAAARSREAPVIVVGLLHQGFQTYAEQLS